MTVERKLVYCVNCTKLEGRGGKGRGGDGLALSIPTFFYFYECRICESIHQDNMVPVSAKQIISSVTVYQASLLHKVKRTMTWLRPYISKLAHKSTNRYIIVFY